MKKIGILGWLMYISLALFIDFIEVLSTISVFLGFLTYVSFAFTFTVFPTLFYFLHGQKFLKYRAAVIVGGVTGLLPIVGGFLPEVTGMIAVMIMQMNKAASKQKAGDQKSMYYRGKVLKRASSIRNLREQQA